MKNNKYKEIDTELKKVINSISDKKNLTAIKLVKIQARLQWCFKETGIQLKELEIRSQKSKKKNYEKPNKKIQYIY